WSRNICAMDKVRRLLEAGPGAKPAESLGLHAATRSTDHEKCRADEGDDHQPFHHPVPASGLFHRHLRQKSDPRFTRFEQTRGECLKASSSGQSGQTFADHLRCTPMRPGASGSLCFWGNDSPDYRNSAMGERSSRNAPLGTETVCQLADLVCIASR